MRALPPSMSRTKKHWNEITQQTCNSCRMCLVQLSNSSFIISAGHTFCWIYNLMRHLTLEQLSWTVYRSRGHIIISNSLMQECCHAVPALQTGVENKAQVLYYNTQGWSHSACCKVHHVLAVI